MDKNKFINLKLTEIALTFSYPNVSNTGWGRTSLPAPSGVIGSEEVEFALRHGAECSLVGRVVFRGVCWNADVVPKYVKAYVVNFSYNT